MMKELGKWLGRIAGCSIILNLLMEGIGRKSVGALWLYLTGSPLVFMLNTLIIALPFIVLFLTRRKCFTMAVIFIGWLSVGVINGYLLLFRTTPFTAADLRLVKYALNMITTYLTWFQIILAGGIVVLVVCGCVLIWERAPISREKIPWYGTAGVVTLSTIAICSCITWGMKSGLVAIRFGNIGQAYQEYGIPYCFANSLLNTGISKPNSYDSKVVSSIEAEMVPDNTYILKENQPPNIIMIQLESFFDPTLNRNYAFEKDPIPFFRYLKTNFPSGYLNVPSVGAGTANTEFECITGMNLDFFGPGEYPYKTILQKTPCESMAFNMKELGYTAHAIHNNEGTFYDRHKVFAQLGFDTFTPIEYMYDIERNPIGWCKDDILVEEIVKTLDSTENQDFIYTISVQGHGAYPDFEYYCEQIREMDHFIRTLINTLNRRDEPMAVVLYGDHLPGFSWEEADMENLSLFQTEYVIWNNLNLKASKKHVESYQLTSYLLNLLDIHEGTMIRFHQAYLDTYKPDTKMYLENMKVLEYDILYGDHEIYGGESPYQVTDLQMGITPVTVNIISYQEPNLLVFGNHFNQYSTVCIDDKMMETMQVGKQLLIVKDVAEKKLKQDSVVTVKQIGKDKIALGTAEDLTKEHMDTIVKRGEETRQSAGTTR